jgi:hypothetical protein
VLFGRYLCGDLIPHTEQLELLEFLRERYPGETEQKKLHEVLKCLVSAGIVPTTSGAARDLAEYADWAGRANAEPAELAFVRKTMDTPSAFGRRYV